MGTFELTQLLNKADLGSLQKSVGTLGNVYIVIGSGESYLTAHKDAFNRTYPDNTQVVHTTVASAYAATTSGRNDVIILDGNTSHTVTAALAVTKSRVNFVGLDYLMGIRRKYGQSSKIVMGVTAAATDLGVVINTGIRNSFRGIKFDSSNTKAESIYSFVDGGEYTFVENCEIYKSTDLDVTGAAELVANGDSATYKDCYIGSTVNAISGAVIRPCVTFSRGLAATGAVARDVTFDGCIFARNCGNTANRFIYGAEANAVERMGLFNNCIFWNAALASATPAQNVAFGATQTDGSVLLNNCASIGAATAMSTTIGVFVNGPVPAADTTGIALQTT